MMNQANQRHHIPIPILYFLGLLQKDDAIFIAVLLLVELRQQEQKTSGIGQRLQVT